MLNSVTPFFIVDDLTATIQFYQSRLGFQVRHQGGDGQGPDFWAMLGRDHVTFMFKHTTSDVHPQPNASRHEWAAWDAYVYTSDPDSLYSELLARKAPMRRQLADTSDGLRAFEITDSSGYVLCFGCPIEK